MSEQQIKVPDIGDFDAVPVIELLVAVGDTVKLDQGLVTLESDKATMEVPSSAAGVIKELRIKVGDEPWHTREETSKYTDLLADRAVAGLLEDVRAESPESEVTRTSAERFACPQDTAVGASPPVISRL